MISLITGVLSSVWYLFLCAFLLWIIGGLGLLAVERELGRDYFLGGAIWMVELAVTALEYLLEHLPKGAKNWLRETTISIRQSINDHQ